MAGPYCTMVLGDMGAEVIKIENFPEGDGSRRFEPKVNDESYCFAVLNRNKKSVALDMKHPQGQGDIHEARRQADIIIENFRPGVTQKAWHRLRGDQENQSRRHLLRRSPASARPVLTAKKGGFDIMAQGMVGIM